jgi:outer membrane protein insertion porin family
MGIYKRITVFVFLAVLAAYAGFAQEGEWYQGKPIKDIVFTGLRHVKAAELEGFVESYRGRMFSDAVFWEIQGKLYSLEYFETITPSAVRADAQGSEVIIRFAVTERPIVSRVVFDGNKGVRRSELLDVISIKANDVVNQSRIQMDEQAIISKYLEKGYPDVRVRSDTQAGPNANLLLTFYITEGEKISITEFHFEGNSVFSSRTLRGQLSLRSKNLIHDGAFQEAKLLADRESIARYYHDRGYIDAAVIDVIRDVTKDEKGSNNLVLTFRISEGELYTLGGVTFEGNRIFSTEQLSKLIQSKTGEVVNARRLEQDLQRVADLYFENGYIFNTIGREENKDPVSGVVSYNIPIVERGRAHIENIIVRGNAKTKTNVILREIPLEPGDVFSKTKVMDAMRNLYNTQFFSSVVPDTPQGSEDSLMDLVFTVEEQPTTNIQFGLTFSGSADPESFPISGLIKWEDSNLFGTGNQLGADLNSSVVDSTSVSLNYTHRWIFGLPLSGGFDFTAQYAKRLAALDKAAPTFTGGNDETGAYPDGFRSYEEYEAANKLPPNEYLMEYNQWYLSLGFSTGYRWGTFLGNLTLSGGIRAGLTQNTYDNQLYRPFDPILRQNNNSWTPKNSAWTSLSLDQRDIFYDPSRGYYASERFGLYGVFEQELEHYFRSDSRAEYFFTLFNIPVTEKWSFKSVFGIHTGLSFVIKQPWRDEGLPVIGDTSKLAVDGMFTGRGWSGEYRNKGLVLWENWAEVRFPLVPNILAWDFFFDAAGVETTQGQYFQNGNFTIENLRFSFGTGVRFTLPQFPFRFSFAKRFKIEDGVVQWAKGAIPFGDPKDSASGIDPVISFARSD